MQPTADNLERERKNKSHLQKTGAFWDVRQNRTIKTCLSETYFYCTIYNVLFVGLRFSGELAHGFTRTQRCDLLNCIDFMSKMSPQYQIQISAENHPAAASANPEDVSRIWGDPSPEKGVPGR